MQKKGRGQKTSYNGTIRTKTLKERNEKENRNLLENRKKCGNEEGKDVVASHFS